MQNHDEGRKRAFYLMEELSEVTIIFIEIYGNVNAPNVKCIGVPWRSHKNKICSSKIKFLNFIYFYQKITKNNLKWLRYNKISQGTIYSVFVLLPSTFFSFFLRIYSWKNLQWCYGMCSSAGSILKPFFLFFLHFWLFCF